MRQDRVSIHQIKARKQDGEKICAVTAYDCTFARLVDEAGVDMILVGDSVANTVMGLDSTVPVTLGQMIYHGEAVMRADPRALVVVDMPFGSVNDGAERALNRAIKVFKRTGADAVKIEGGRGMATVVQAVVEAGIPVVGHVGLMPQYRAMLGGLKVQGKELEAARQITEDAQAIAGAGVFAIVLEAVPAPLAKLITGKISIPTIGIGAGAGCDGQILVLHDILGFSDHTPKFAGRWADLGQETVRAVSAYREAVRSGGFPDAEHSFIMDESILDKL
ncbi:MAG: 3-methyl-2-oxobutanoate hydroxymethyltransferase [Candidatus Glassbacteria bacterium]|nr:3-methyl-2-oxobutanoate hydroxymethyltransferase [Candidatus Glassbacteria bacterium]